MNLFVPVLSACKYVTEFQRTDQKKTKKGNFYINLINNLQHNEQKTICKKQPWHQHFSHAASLPGFSNFSPMPARNLKKGLCGEASGVGKTIMEKFLAAKAAGFDGVEVMSHLDRNEVLKARDATGLTVPSVCGFNALEVFSFRS